MKKIISMLMITSMLAVAAIPVFAEDTAPAAAPSAQTSTGVKAQAKKGPLANHFKKLLKVESLKAQGERIQNLEKKILTLKAKDNKEKGLSQADSQAAMQTLKDEFKTMKAARELTADEKDKIKALNTQIKQILQSSDTKEQKQTAIKPLADQIKTLVQSKKDIIKQQITQLENQLKSLQTTVKSEKAAAAQSSDD